jgi:glycogen phosphorylase
VAKLHSEIIRKKLFADFADLWPEKFQNKTNGITQRRWLLQANPDLSDLITSRIGAGWITDLFQLRKLEPLTQDRAFLKAFRATKQANKVALAAHILATVGVTVDPESLFDVQVKRLHEYKRQLLLVLYIIVLFDRMIRDPNYDMHPRTFIFSAKAAPGYYVAKLIIRLIHGVAEVVNSHPLISKKIKVVFLPDYRVSLAEKIIPAANVSEQISLAGTEASGTGNMKLMLNGALTVGTLDGANVEIGEAVGDDNIFIFGLRADEVAVKRPAYRSRDVYESDPEIRRAINLIQQNVFCVLSPGLFDPIIQTLLDYNDYYMLLADLRAYIETQEAVDALYRKPLEWDRKALLNVARSGVFSSDRTIREYADEIWHVNACDVE